MVSGTCLRFAAREFGMLLVIAWLFSVVAAATPTTPKTREVVLLSDPHFDPFRDPAKVRQLDAAPAAAWAGILRSPESARAQENYMALKSACGIAQPDAEQTLLDSSFAAAARAGGSHPAFVLLAGDILVHKFDCQYAQTAGTGGQGLQSFAAKTVQYVSMQLQSHFPKVPVYIALGNNDSGCGDYRFDTGGSFLSDTAEAIAHGWRGATVGDIDKAARDYRQFGSYSLPLGGIGHGRIIVVDDIYLSSNHRGCDGKPAAESGEGLLRWLDGELDAAQRRGEQVWVLTHIPPGVNVYNTFQQKGDVCAGSAPAMFLSSERITEILTRHASIIRLVVAGHTHIDEMRLFGEDQGGRNRVVIKSVPSITPISGNGPSFLSASVEPRTGTLRDYRLHVADASIGTRIGWSIAYDYAAAYGEPRLDPSALQELVQQLGSGSDQYAIKTSTYRAHYTTGLKRLALQALWPQYVCSMHHDTPAGYAQCACGAGKPDE